MKFVIGEAGPFDGDHAGADWVFGVANSLEKSTFQRSFDSLQNFSAKAFRMFA
jgi:hypothetical protein